MHVHDTGQGQGFASREGMKKESSEGKILRVWGWDKGAGRDNGRGNLRASAWAGLRARARTGLRAIATDAANTGAGSRGKEPCLGRDKGKGRVQGKRKGRAQGTCNGRAHVNHRGKEPCYIRDKGRGRAGFQASAKAESRGKELQYEHPILFRAQAMLFCQKHSSGQGCHQSWEKTQPPSTYPGCHQNKETWLQKRQPGRCRSSARRSW